MQKYLINSSYSIAEKIIDIENKLTAKFELESFIDKDVATIYNPLVYAAQPHQDYLNKYCNTPKEVMFLGMNPGPFGMCQNGVPFGEIKTVKEWLKIKGKVHKPKNENLHRKIEGMDIKKSEVSGLRLWGLFKQMSKKPEKFFEKCIVYNYIPLCFISSSGNNIAPNQLKPNIRKRIITLSNESLKNIIHVLQVKKVVCVGKWTEAQILDFKKKNNLPFEVLGIMHPSPLNSKANKDYIGKVRSELVRLGIAKYICEENEDENETKEN